MAIMLFENFNFCCRHTLQREQLSIDSANRTQQYKQNKFEARSQSAFHSDLFLVCNFCNDIKTQHSFDFSFTSVVFICFQKLCQYFYKIYKNTLTVVGGQQQVIGSHCASSVLSDEIFKFRYFNSTQFQLRYLLPAFALFYADIRCNDNIIISYLVGVIS